ncbi:MAG: MarR family transcriptional regulator [Nitrolancea sp.]
MTSITPEEDLTLLVTALHAAFDTKTLTRLAEAGFGDLRQVHGYVFQHLVPGPIRVSDLAHKLGMTPQGASKFVIELEGLGYVRRRVDPDDQRNRMVELTEHGWDGINATRRIRVEINEDARALLGEADTTQLIDALRRLAEQTGGLQELLGRRLRPGRD